MQPKPKTYMENTMTSQSREQALLETIRQGLSVVSQKSDAMLGDRSRYVGLTEIAKYAECPRGAIAAKLETPTLNLEKLLVTQRGHWFEEGIKNTLLASGLNSIHQLEINLRKKCGIIKAHLDFTLVWEKPIQAVRILEIKSTERIPDEPRKQHSIQAQGQVDLLCHCWNKPVLTFRNESGMAIHENMTFPEICRTMLNLDIPAKARQVSAECWILYLSMKEAKAFGPYQHDTVKMAEMLDISASFYADLKQSEGCPSHLNDLAYAQGFYPLCYWCGFNADCPKFRQGAYQPQWEAAIQKLQELKKEQESIHSEISEIEDALKQAYRISETKDWIDTGEHRFRLSTVAGRKSLNQDALKNEVADILHGFGSEIDVENLFASCIKQRASFPRLTISTINQ